MKLDKRLLALARSVRLALYATIGLGAAGGLAMVFQARVMSATVTRAFLEGQGLSELAGLLSWWLALSVLRSALIWAGEVSANRLAVRVKTDLRERLLDHLLAIGPLQFSGSLEDQGRTDQGLADPGERGERTGELVNTAIEGVESLDAYFSQYLPQVALAALLPLIVLVFVFPQDLLSGIILLVTAPLIPIFVLLIGRLAEEVTRRQWLGLSRLSAHFLDALQGLATLKILGRSKAQVKVIKEASEQFRHKTMEVLRLAFLSALALELVSTLSTAVVAVTIGLRVLYGRLSFEQAFFVLLLAPEFYLPLRNLGSRFHAALSGAEAAKRIFGILGEESRKTGRLEGWMPEETPPGIRFDGVSFAYSAERPALKEVSFEIPAGQTVSLVGDSGTGKSTVAALLLGFLEAQDGSISCDGETLTHISLQDLRRQIAWVPQQPYLFHGTIAENIRLGHAEASLEEVIAAAKYAYAHDFINAFPDGYFTIVGERGATLSGGQAQRLALARAFLKATPILILDEPTTNLDPENARLVQAAIQRLAHGRTTLLITHSPALTAQADRIVVLSHGRVLESGKQVERPQGAKLHPSSLPLFQSSNQTSNHPQGAILQPSNLPIFQPSILPLLHLLAPFAGRIALSAALGWATVASGTSLMALSAYIISAAALHPSVAALQMAIAGVRFFGVNRGVFRYLERYVSHDVTFRVIARLRVAFYQALEPLAPAGLATQHSGDLLSRAISDANSLEQFYVRAVAPQLTAALTGISILAFLAWFDPWLALPLLVVWLVGGVLLPALVRRLSQAPGACLVQARGALATTLVDGIQGMADLLAYGAEGWQKAQAADHGRALTAAQARLAWIGGLQSGGIHLLAQLGAWGVLALAIPLVRTGEIAGVALAALVLAALSSCEALLPLPLAAQRLESSLAAARRLFALMDARPQVEAPRQPEAAPGGRNLHLAVHSLSFAYPQPDSAESHSPPHTTLCDLSFDLPAGKKLGLVGPSGAGKTTLANLLLRFWDYRQGEIHLAGKELRAYRPEDVRGVMAVVSQATHLFNATVWDNLRIARPDATREEIEQAASRACIHTFIQALPQGYDTWIGEGGLRLSGGQRQRLAIARALLKDAPILILDEPTANLDRQVEQEILAAIFDLMAGRSTLLISHRLDGMQAMDEILVLVEGRIIERGTHTQLLAFGGWYARMWETGR